MSIDFIYFTKFSVIRKPERDPRDPNLDLNNIGMSSFLSLYIYRLDYYLSVPSLIFREDVSFLFLIERDQTFKQSLKMRINLE